MSYASIKIITDILCDVVPLTGDFTSLLRNSIDDNKAKYRIAQAIRLPTLISKSDDILFFRSFTSEPSFITTQTIVGDVICQPTAQDEQDLAGKVVIICNADPGWDWLFTRDIAALITCYGGFNSHMAIRTNELNIPAVIGCGPEKYKQYEKAGVVRINCKAKTVDIL